MGMTEEIRMSDTFGKLKMDSIDRIETILKIEDKFDEDSEFGLEINEDDFNELSTIQDLVDLTKKLTA